MKYLILLPVTIEADPADFAGAARKGFQALADLLDGHRQATIHLLPQDGSDEAARAQQVLRSAFRASATAEIR